MTNSYLFIGANEGGRNISGYRVSDPFVKYDYKIQKGKNISWFVQALAVFRMGPA